MQQVQVSRDELLKAIWQEIMTMALDKNYTDKLWTLLLLEDALQSLYIKEGITMRKSLKREYKFKHTRLC